jgi:hypothetical protein
MLENLHCFLYEQLLQATPKPEGENTPNFTDFSISLTISLSKLLFTGSISFIWI